MIRLRKAKPADWNKFALCLLYTDRHMHLLVLNVGCHC